MAKILILLSLLALAVAWAARWWFWVRVREKGRRLECSLTVAEVYTRLGVPKRRPSELRDAAAVGNAIRDAGLRLLEQDGLALAKSRRTGWWSLRVLPGLLAVVMVFAAITKRVAPGWVLAAGMILIALHVAVRISGLGIELRAVKRGFAELDKKGGIRRMSEEEALIDCARASVWDTVLPW